MKTTYTLNIVVDSEFRFRAFAKATQQRISQGSARVRSNIVDVELSATEFQGYVDRLGPEFVGNQTMILLPCSPRLVEEQRKRTVRMMELLFGQDIQYLLVYHHQNLVICLKSS